MNIAPNAAPPSDIAALKAALVDGQLSVESRILWLCELARQSARTGLAEEGLKHAKEAIELAEANKKPEEKANGLDAAGMCHYHRGDHLMAVACCIDAYEGYAAYERYDKMGHVLTSVAGSFAAVGAMDLAEAALRGCLNIAIRLKDDFLLARTQNTLGITLGDLHRFDEADALLVASIDNLRNIGRPEHIPKIMTNRGDLHKKNAARMTAENNLDGAKECLQRGIVFVEDGFRVAIEANNPFQIAEKAGSLGIYHFLLGKYAKASTYMELAIARSRALDHAPVMAESMLYLGMIAEVNGNFADAIHWMQQGLALSKKRELKMLRSRIHDSIADVFNKMGQTADANSHRDAASEWHSHIAQTNREVEREARAMWQTHFSQHPLLI